MSRTVIFINGRPRSGKDSCIQFMREMLGDVGVNNATYSSIDPVKALLKQMGFNLGAKTAKDRNLLAEFGDSLEAYNSFRSVQTASFVVDFFRDKSSGVVFLQAREPAIIERIGGMLTQYMGVKVRTALVESHRSEDAHTNLADSGVERMIYDRHIPNYGTLEGLKSTCHHYLADYGLIPLV